MALSYEELIQFCDAEIRAGRIQSVTKVLGELTLTKVPRPYRLPIAKICRRSGQLATGLRLLTRLVRPVKKGDSQATVFEMAEYAALLTQNGSVSEALELLNSLDDSECADVHLFRGFCHIMLWDYTLSLTHFDAYLKTKPPEYQALVAKVNLAAALVATRQHGRAERQIDENLQLARAAKASLLIANCYELRGQILFQQGRLKECREVLEESLRILSEARILDQLNVQKWLAVLAATEKNSVAPLIKFRPEAASRRHWYAVRECDLYSVKIKFDQDQFDKLYFGSPIQGYRNRILEEIKSSPSPHYFLGGKHSFCLDLASGEISGGGELNAGKKIHQVLTVLSRDLYAPMSVATFFSELYDGEYFDIFSSPGRVHQIITRTKTWLKKNQIPVEIHFNDGGYSLEITGPFCLKISAKVEKVDGKSLVLDRLQRLYQSQEFTLQEACEKLTIPKSTLHRVAKSLTEGGFLEKIGTGRETKYKVALNSR